MTNLKLCFFLTLITSMKAEDISEESIEHYQKLLQDFQKNASHWEQPTDSRKFFKLINEKEPAAFYGHYDFIIVGAGGAGSVLTNRLTDSGKFKVLLLEAGGRENGLTNVPGFATYLARSDFNWGYKTIPQNNSCLGYKNKQCSYPTGKVVGGTSVINLAVYVRGNREDFDKWGSNNPGWDYKSVLPYFEKSENSTLDFEDLGYHGHRGLVSVESIRYHPEITDIFLKSTKERGRKVLDYNGKNQNGYSTFQMTTKNGRRCSASKAYVKPAMHKENLEILDYSLGTRILIEDKKACGVEFIRDGKRYKALASKEVIISAGTINSPQILILSGIGPKEHLEELGISMVQNLPVGKVFHDHILFPAILFSTNISTQSQPSMQDHLKHYLEGYGLLTVSIGITGVGFERPKVITRNPRNEYAFFSGLIEQAAPFFVDFLEMAEENWQAMSKPLTGKYIWSIAPLLLHPKSKGTIKLKTKDPLDFPLVDSNFYSDKNGYDMNEMLTVIRDIFKVSNTPAFQSIDSKYVSDPFPACSKYKHFSADYWRCALKQITCPIYHEVATCKMGPKDDKTAVVDNKLKVHGIGRLRVADASIIPFPLSGHPAAAVYMIGEKLSDIIREEYGDL